MGHSWRAWPVDPNIVNKFRDEGASVVTHFDIEQKHIKAIGVEYDIENDLEDAVPQISRHEEPAQSAAGEAPAPAREHNISSTAPSPEVLLALGPQHS